MYTNPSSLGIHGILMKNNDKQTGARSRGGFRSRLLVSMLILIFFIIFSAPLYADVNLKIMAKNPSEFTPQEVSVKYYLPKLIKLENVVDVGNLELGYDIRREQYYVHRVVSLKPQESVSYDVAIQDIWLIDTTLLSDMKAHVNKIVRELKESEYGEAVTKLKRDIDQRIDAILNRQEEFLIEQVEPVEHINAYTLNKEQLKIVKEKIGSLEKLLEAISGQGAATQVLGESSLGTRKGERIIRFSAKKGDDSFGQDSTEGVDCFGDDGQEIPINVAPEIVVLKIDVENSSTEMSQTIPLKYVLAKEVTAKDVVDSNGLQVGFDFESGLYYVFDNAVELEAGEKKTFEVILKNNWVIDQRDLFSLKIHVDSMLKVMKGLKAFSAIRAKCEDVVKDIDKLLKHDVMKNFDQEYVMTFREGQQQVTEIRKEVVYIEDFMKRSGIEPKITVVDKQKICGEAKKLWAGAESIDSVKGLKTEWEKIKAGVLSKEINLLAGTIFQGKALATAVVWQIIKYLVFFLMLISGTFYFTHIRQKKSIMFDALTGAFTRVYILERLKEELKIARGAKNRCSLLILDVDKFKTINDTYGHAAGDTVLKEFVVAMRKGVRATDLVGRFGGDEFLIVLPTSSKDIACRIAEGIVRFVRNHDIYIGQQKLNITASIGVATFPDDSATAEDLFNKADKALYVIKKKGRDGMSVYGA